MAEDLLALTQTENIEPGGASRGKVPGGKLQAEAARPRVADVWERRRDVRAVETLDAGQRDPVESGPQVVVRQVSAEHPAQEGQALPFGPEPL